jgi:type IV secretory pathway VirB10-like protein
MSELEDPMRWVDDPSIPTDLRGDLARVADAPGAGYGVDAGLARLEASLAAHAAEAAMTAKLVKIGLAIVGAGAVVALVLFLWPTHKPAAAPVAQIVPIGTQQTVAIEQPATSVAAEPVPTTPPTEPKVAVAPPPKLQLADEVAQLQRVRELLKTDPQAALRGASEGDKLYARGQLHPEREVIAIDALNRLGRRSEAQARSKAFLTAYPDNPYAEHIRSLQNP